MNPSWADDVEDSGFPEEFDDESPSEESNEEDKSASCKSRVDQFSALERRSHGSSTDLSVTARSDGSKCYSRFSHSENISSAESEYHLLDLLSDSGFPMTQVNGQRKLGPPPGWTKPPPDPSCEVFVGKIPRNLYEHEIYPIFKKVGDIYEIRLMMDFSGTNRGYCFVMFTEVEYAKRAIKELNNYAIRPGRKIGVVASINNCRLWIGQLPTNIEAESVIKKFYETTDDVSKVAVYKYPNGQVRCALVSYNTHRAAAMARRRLLPERGTLFPNVEISVDWAPPNMSFNNVVEINGERDEAGKLQINQSSTITHSKRRGSQKRSGDDFLDNSIKNYLQENSATLSANQRKSLESSLRSQKSVGRGCAFPPRRKGYRANQAKSFIPESRGRGCIKENPNYNRSRSLPVSPKENYTVGRDGLWYPKNRDINGNIMSPESANEPNDLRNEHTFDFTKIPSLSVSRGKNKETVPRGPIKILSRKGGSDGHESFNLFEQYSLLPAKMSESAWEEKSCNSLSCATISEGSVPNVFRSLETRSDGDLRKPQDNPSNYTDEKCANFAEFGKWNSTESFVPRVEISEKVNDDTSKGFCNQRMTFRPSNESVIQSQHKIMPNYRVLSPLTNWNGNYNPNSDPRCVEAFDENHSNSAGHENVDYSQNRVGNYCEECAVQSGINQPQLYFSGEVSALYHQQQAQSYVPHHDWRLFNGNFVNQGIFAGLGGFPRASNFPPQSLFSTSSFADCSRFQPQIYLGNSEKSLRPRPILNRLTATVGENK